MTRVRILLGLATVALLVSAPPASAARSAVYGGHVPRGEPIVVTADSKFQKLQTIVLASELTCVDGNWIPFSIDLTAAKPLPGFDPPSGALKMTKNAKGTFAGRFMGSSFSETYSYAVIASVTGKLSKTRASGSFDVTETVIDNATGEEVVTCYSGKTKFIAARSPGRVFAGTTKQQEPIVVLADAKRHKIQDFYFSWVAPCDDGGYYHNEFARWQDFSMSRAGSFQITDMYPWRSDDGSMGSTNYKLTGKVGRSKASGTVKVDVSQFDASGTRTMSCGSGQLKWSALTG